MQREPLLFPGTWQPLPGAEGMSIYPFFGKPDSTCSNLCLIDTGSEFVMVDCGTNVQQLETVVRLIGEIPGGLSRPVFLFVTHCHVDHCYPLLSGSPLDTLRLLVAAEEEGAAAMAGGDVHLTLGELFRKSVQPHPIAIPLLCRGDRGRERIIDLSGCGTVRLGGGAPSGEGSPGPVSQHVWLPSGTCITVYHTPGHTPDSICIRAGSVLFCGDVIFAMSPGVAGIAGFSREDLIASARNLLDLLETGTVSVWYPGHGDPLDSPAMAAALRKLEKEARAVTDIHSFDLSRLEESRDHALDVLEEADRLFGIIGGRLLSLSFLLETLGEETEAGRLREMLDISAADSVLCDFHQFCTDVREGRRVEILLVMKAVQVLRKLRRSLYCEELQEVVDSSLLWRAERLLEEFLATSRDIPRNPAPDAVDLLSLLETLVASTRSPPVSDEAFISAADDPEAFRKALVARLAFFPPLPELFLDMDHPEEGVPPIRSDRFRLFDSLMALLEDLEASGFREARLGIRQQARAVDLVIQAGCKGANPGLPPASVRRHRRRFRLCGGDLFLSPGEGGLTCTISFEAAEQEKGR